MRPCARQRRRPRPSRDTVDKSWQPQHDAVKSMAPLMRSATPEDIVEATLGLLRTRYATGQILAVDGGLTLVR